MGDVDGAIGSIRHILKASFADAFRQEAGDQEAGGGAAAGAADARAEEDGPAAAPADAEAAAQEDAGASIPSGTGGEAEAEAEEGIPLLTDEPDDSGLEAYDAPDLEAEIEGFGAEELRRIEEGLRSNADAAAKLRGLLDAKHAEASLVDDAEADRVRREGLLLKADIPQGRSALELDRSQLARLGRQGEDLIAVSDVVRDYEVREEYRRGQAPARDMPYKRRKEDVPHYLEATASVKLRRDAADKARSSRLATAGLEEGEDPRDTIKAKFLRSSRQGSGRATWLARMSAEEKRRNNAILHRMEHRMQYLRNPRAEAQRRPEPSSHILERAPALPVQQGYPTPGAAFTASPPTVRFTEYAVGDVLTTSVAFTNATGLSRRIRVIPPTTPYFSVSLLKYPGDDGFVAPGMTCSVTVQFSPDSLADYDDALVVVSEQDQFRVPLLAQREPPQLTLPAVLTCPVCLVGVHSSISFQCTNLGGPGRFRLFAAEDWPARARERAGSTSVDIQPFRVRPTAFELGKGDSVEMVVEYMPDTTGKATRDFVMVCDNCEVKQFTVEGTCSCVDVRVQDTVGDPPHSWGLTSLVRAPAAIAGPAALGPPPALLFQPTTVGASQRLVFRVRNATPLALPFSWTAFRAVLPSTAALQRARGAVAAAHRGQEREAKLAASKEIKAASMRAAAANPVHELSLVQVESDDEGEEGEGEGAKDSGLGGAEEEEGGDAAPDDADDSSAALNVEADGGEAADGASAVAAAGATAFDPRGALPSPGPLGFLVEESRLPASVSRPFSVEPAEGVLPAEGEMEFTVTFAPREQELSAAVVQLVLHEVPHAALPHPAWLPSQHVEQRRREKAERVAAARKKAMQGVFADGAGGEGKGEEEGKAGDGWEGGDAFVEPPRYSVPALNLPLGGRAAPVRAALWPSAVESPGSLLPGEEARHEVVLRNLSDAPAEFAWRAPALVSHASPPPLAVPELALAEEDAQSEGGFWSLALSPPSGTVPPGGSLTVLATFSAHCLGAYDVAVPCAVSHGAQPLGLRLRANVVGPRVRFLQPEVDVGLMAVNTGADAIVQVQNLSSVPAQWDIAPQGCSRGALERSRGALPTSAATAGGGRGGGGDAPARRRPGTRGPGATRRGDTASGGGRQGRAGPGKARSRGTGRGRSRRGVNTDEEEGEEDRVNEEEEEDAENGASSWVPARRFHMPSGFGDEEAGHPDRLLLPPPRPEEVDGEGGVAPFLLDDSQAGALESRAGGSPRRPVGAVVTCVPCAGELPPHGTALVRVRCAGGAMPERVRGVLECRAPGAPSCVARLRGEVQAPRVYLSAYHVDVGVAYTSVSVERTVELVNLSNLAAEFEWEGVLEPTPQAVVGISPARGQLGAKERRVINIKVLPQEPGPLDALVTCRVSGVDEPLGFAATGTVRGLVLAWSLLPEAPGVDLFKEEVGDLEGATPPPPLLDFGDVTLGKRRTLFLSVTNHSGIPTQVGAEVLHFPVGDAYEPCSSLEESPSALRARAKKEMEEAKRREEELARRAAGKRSRQRRSRRTSTRLSVGSVHTLGASGRAGTVTGLEKPLLDRKEEPMRRYQSGPGRTHVRRRREVTEDRDALAGGRGAAFSVFPACERVAPWERAVVEVTCFSDMPGEYEDEVEVVVEGREEPLRLRARARVVGSPLSLATNCVGLDASRTPAGLYFGETPGEAPAETRSVRVENASPMDAVLEWRLMYRAPEGEGAVDVSLDLGDGASPAQVKLEEPARASQPLPFRVAPARQRVPAYGSAAFAVDFVPPTGCERFTAAMVADARWRAAGGGRARDGKAPPRPPLPRCLRVDLEARTIAPRLAVDKREPGEGGAIELRVPATAPLSDAAAHRKRVTLSNPLSAPLVCSFAVSGSFALDELALSAPDHPVPESQRTALVRHAGPGAAPVSLPPQGYAVASLRLVRGEGLEAQRTERPGTMDAARLKLQYEGALDVTFASGASQRLALSGVVSRPAVVVTPPQVVFATTHVEERSVAVVHLANPTAVEARWKMEHIPFAGVRTFAYEEERAEAEAHTDDPSVFAFSTSSGALPGPTLTAEDAGGAAPAGTARQDAPPLPVRVTFRPHKNLRYRSRFRVVVHCGAPFDVVLTGEGTYQEHK